MKEAIEGASNVAQKVEIADQIAFFQAAETNDTINLSSLIEKKVNVNSRDKYGDTALHFASINNNTESVKILLRKGADRNFVNLKGETALQMTQRVILNDYDPENNYEETIKLLSAKEHISGGGVGGVATYDISHYEFAKALQDRGDIMLMHHIDARDQLGNTALHYVVKFGNAEMVEFLLNKGASLDITNGQSYTPLNLAILYGKNEIIKVLLKEEQFNSDNTTVRQFYSSCKEVDLYSIRALIANALIEDDLIKVLISKELTRDDLNKKDQGGNTPLHFASEYGRLEIVKFLLENKADPSLKNNEGKTALRIADANKIYSNSPNVYSKIIEALSPIDKLNENGNTALHISASRGQIIEVGNLLKNKADPAMHDEEGAVALHFAVESNQLEVVKLLLQYKASPDEANIVKITPLHVAIIRGNLEIVELLLQHVADKDPINIEGNTPLHLAIIYSNTKVGGNLEIIEFLLKHGADKDPINLEGNTPLHLATGYGETKIVEFLLKHGADKDPINLEGNTPLHLAIKHGGNLEIVELLLKEKADTSLKNNQGETAFDFAASYGRAKICELLKNKAAHPLGGSSKEAALVIPDCDDPSTSTGKRKVDEVSGEERAPKKPHNKERS